MSDLKTCLTYDNGTFSYFLLRRAEMKYQIMIAEVFWKHHTGIYLQFRRRTKESDELVNILLLGFGSIFLKHCILPVITQSPKIKSEKHHFQVECNILQIFPKMLWDFLSKPLQNFIFLIDFLLMQTSNWHKESKPKMKQHSLAMAAGPQMFVLSSLLVVHLFNSPRYLPTLSSKICAVKNQLK